MTKFIIGVDAFSDPESNDEKEFVTHTQFPKFIAEIIFIESSDKMGFKLDSLKLLWNEACDKNELDLALADAESAILYYTKKSMELDV